MSTRNPTGAWIEPFKGARGVTYRVRWYDPVTGKRKTEGCGRDKKLAKQRRSEIEANLRSGRTGVAPATLVSDFVEKLDGLMAGKTADTIKKTKGSLSLLVKLTGVRYMTDISRPAVMDFRAARYGQVSIATVNKDLRQIKSALSYAEDAGLLASNPLLRWKKLTIREPQKQVRVIEEDEFVNLLKACLNPGFKALLIVAYRQGMRRTELTNLRWTAVDTGRSLIHVVNVPEAGELTKSRKNRTLPMDADVHTLLVQLAADVPKMIWDGKQVPKSPYVFTWPDGRPFKPDWITREFRKLVAMAGIDRCTFHDLRRSFSTSALRMGIDTSVVVSLGGWSGPEVLKNHYTGDVSVRDRRAMDKLAEGRYDRKVSPENGPKAG